MRRHRIVWDTFPRLPIPEQRTKWEILKERRDFLAAEFGRIQRELDGLVVTTCGVRCSGCGTMLETEKDFAAHFRVPDEQHLNLGECPRK